MKNTGKLLVVSYFIVLALLAFNTFYLNSLYQKSLNQKGMLALMQANIQQKGNEKKESNVSRQTLTLQEFLPKGVPEVYGTELGISFDKPVESLKVLAKLDGDLYPNGKLKFSGLSEKAKKRYLSIGQKIACEYCCGAKTLVFQDGKPACGCAHSAAMRGLAMYLLSKHENKFSDEKILAELTKWKTMFFPKQMYAKELATSKRQSAGTQQTEIKEIPDMVGGC